MLGIVEEIKEKASHLGVPPSIVEKDYVISLVLRELWISRVWKNLVFKGGTALRKVYFPDYRFSEDLDFNLVEGDIEGVVEALNGLEKYQNPLFFDVEMKERKGVKYNPGVVVGYEIRIPFYFLRKSGAKAKIRMDVTLGDYERMVLEPVERRINHDYSDYAAFSRVKILAYSLEEIMAEKIRTVFQRVGRPRDLYDIWFLSRRVNMKKVLSVIDDKFAVKGVEFSPEKFVKNKEVYRSNWKHLSLLLGALPDFDEVWKVAVELCHRVEEVMG